MMREISNQTLKEIELDILKAVHRFCEDNNIVYYLCGGTLLGAVRHAGFIPWDDDIDICMPRPDYDRFVASFSNESYYVLNFPDAPGYFLPYAKVCDRRTVLHETQAKDIPNCGVFIDVFPLDGLSDKMESAKKVRKRVDKYMWLNSMHAAEKLQVKSLKHLIKLLIRKLIPQKVILERLVTASKRYLYSQCALVGVTFGFYGDREILDRSIFETRRKIDFEDARFYAPIDADRYLSALYGDYMELPPVEKRVSHHSFKAFWRDETL